MRVIPGSGVGWPGGQAADVPAQTLAGLSLLRAAAGLGWPGLGRVRRTGRHRRAEGFGCEAAGLTEMLPAEVAGWEAAGPAGRAETAEWAGRTAGREQEAAMAGAGGAESGLGWPLRMAGRTAGVGNGHGLGWPSSDTAEGGTEPARQRIAEAARQPAPGTWPRVELVGMAGVSRETARTTDAITADGPERTGSTVINLPGDHWRRGDGPMIAGSYSGAAGAQGESEDEVAIPGAPDTSADTPIARAAQAAMKARAADSKPWPRPRSCRILTIANQKGGVGKTTTAVNLAASLAMHGSRVLVIDLDPQGNASTALDVEHRSGVPSIYSVLVDGMRLANVVRPVHDFPLLRCAPATIDLAGAEIELVPLVARESRLARAVAEYDSSNLDYIFIDCPPSLGLLTVNALVAAPEVLIPIQCEYYALEGLEQLLRTVDLVKSHLNPGLTVSTILLTMFDSRTRLASQVAEEVRGHFGDLVLSSVIPRSVRVSEAPSYGQSVMTYDPGSSGAVAYLEAAREMAFQNVRAATT